MGTDVNELAILAGMEEQQTSVRWRGTTKEKSTSSELGQDHSRNYDQGGSSWIFCEDLGFKITRRPAMLIRLFSNFFCLGSFSFNSVQLVMALDVFEETFPNALDFLRDFVSETFLQTIGSGEMFSANFEYVGWGLRVAEVAKAKERSSLWLASNPSRRWGELFFLAYSPFWIVLCLGVVVPLQLYEVLI